MDLPDKELGCHRTGFEKKCRDLVSSGVCNRWRCLIGSDPQTGETINRHDCIDNMEYVLLLEIAQQTRQAGASVDKVANEVRAASDGSAARDVHLINGIRASFPVLKLASERGMLIEDNSDDRPSDTER